MDPWRIMMTDKQKRWSLNKSWNELKFKQPSWGWTQFYILEAGRLWGRSNEHMNESSLHIPEGNVLNPTKMVCSIQNHVRMFMENCAILNTIHNSWPNEADHACKQECPEKLWKSQSDGVAHQVRQHIRRTWQVTFWVGILLQTHVLGGNLFQTFKLSELNKNMLIYSWHFERSWFVTEGEDYHFLRHDCGKNEGHPFKGFFLWE